MKKPTQLLAAALLAALGAATAAQAQTNDAKGFYVQGDIGLANLNVDGGEKFRLRNTFRSLKQSYKDSGFMPRLSAGYDFGDVRVAGDYTHYKTVSDSVRDGGDSMHLKVKARGVGVAAIYDFASQSRWQPYVGARLALNQIKVHASAATAGMQAHASESSTRLGLGALAGVGYQLNDRMTLDMGYRYNRLRSDLKAHEASVGLRYAFR